MGLGCYGAECIVHGPKSINSRSTGPPLTIVWISFEHKLSIDSAEFETKFLVVEKNLLDEKMVLAEELCNQAQVTVNNNIVTYTMIDILS